ncbi:MAG: hypothetical protein NTY38_02485 [Acidobacteria bacterium]|nr:hypothetical protein [Acidobacteriota bacterium]
MRIILLLLLAWLNGPAAVFHGGGLQCSADHGVPSKLVSKARRWLAAPASVSAGSDTTFEAQWTGGARVLQWDLKFRGPAKRTGHTVTVELPLLSRELRVFTPSERGVMNVDAYPDYKPVAYGHIAYRDRKAWVLPLVSVMDPASDRALSIALPPDANLPHLQVEWSGARTLRLVLENRGIGGGQDSPVRILFVEHAADYRAALKAYSDLYPAYFNPVIRKPEGEGTFYYHHIQAHPDFGEMARQHVRYLWSSFWFTHLGEYLPEETEWAPYTYAKHWKLGQMMSDARIRSFIGEMRAHGIETYAYFNVTEYGGSGGRSGSTEEAARILRERFADALMRDQKGADIPTWEGAMAMNPSRRYSLWPFLQNQVESHLKRLPQIAGFVIDRLDWASRPDYGHQDGLSMEGGRGFENTALPVAEAVQNVCRLAHAAGKRVFVNQFYRIEVLRDTDGVCHENDYLPALGYLTPLRPASAWHLREKYHGDLLRFEAQMKRRLQWALFPQMIARQFPVSQQEPDARAAALQEVYAPLFEPLIAKRQVLEPHVVEVTGANDVNLFVNAAGHFVAPVTSRVRFLSRNSSGSEAVTVRLRVPSLEWAQVFSAEAPPLRVKVVATKQGTEVTIPSHRTVSVLVLGRGPRPAVPSIQPVRFAGGAMPPPVRVEGNHSLCLRIEGEHVGEAGVLEVRLNGKAAGKFQGANAVIELTGPEPAEARVELRAGDEGVWFVPSRITLGSESGRVLAEWQGADPCGRDWYQLVRK